MEKKTAGKKKYGKMVAIALAGVVALPAVLPSNAKAIKFEKKVGGETLKVQPFAFAQITSEALRGQGQDSLKFGADRVRIGYKLSWGKVFSKLQLDFNRPDISKNTAGLPDIIKDVVVGYKFDKAAKLQAGMFKTPVGYDFNLPGKKLDITKRGMEKALVLERAAGAMLSGSDIGGIGLGYDVGIFNPTARSSAVLDTDKGGAKAGDAQGYAARLRYDMNKTLHAEVSYGTSTDAGGQGTDDYRVWDAAVAYHISELTLKAEYIHGSNIKGIDGNDQYVWYAHAGYRFLPMFEGVIRHYQGEADAGNTSLGNTFLGLNIFLKPDKPEAARIQLNYVLASGDKEDWKGIGGYKDNAFLAQFQVSF